MEIEEPSAHISWKQKQVIDLIPCEQWRGIDRVVPALKDLHRKLHLYRYDDASLRIFKNEIEAWKEMVAKKA